MPATIIFCCILEMIHNSHNYFKFFLSSTCSLRSQSWGSSWQNLESQRTRLGTAKQAWDLTSLLTLTSHLTSFLLNKPMWLWCSGVGLECLPSDRSSLRKYARVERGQPCWRTALLAHFCAKASGGVGGRNLIWRQ